MTDIISTLAKANDLDPDDFILKISDPNGNFSVPGTTNKKSGIVMVGDKSYKVTVNTDSKKVQVLRQFDNYRDFFSQKTKTAIALKTQIESFVRSYKFSLITNNLARFRNIITAPQYKDADSIEIANYGFSNCRSNVNAPQLIKRLDPQKEISFNKIDRYNSGINISSTTLKLDKYYKTLDAIALIASDQPSDDKPQLKEYLNIDEGSKISPEQLKKWATFLSKPDNFSKIDIPLKIYHWLQLNNNNNTATGTKATGWDAAFKSDPDKALMSFIAKNISTKDWRISVDQDVIRVIIDKIKEFAQLSAIRKDDRKTYDQKYQDFMKYESWLPEKNNENASSSKDQTRRVTNTPTFMMVQDIIMYATFRETSKLGLSFFKEQGVPVMLQYSDNHLKSLRGAGFNSIINENSWKKGTLDGDNKKSPITHSELRQIYRMQQQEGVNNNGNPELQENLDDSNRLQIQLPEGLTV